MHDIGPLCAAFISCRQQRRGGDEGSCLKDSHGFDESLAVAGEASYQRASSDTGLVKREELVRRVESSVMARAFLGLPCESRKEDGSQNTAERVFRAMVANSPEEVSWSDFAERAVPAALLAAVACRAALAAEAVRVSTEAALCTPDDLLAAGSTLDLTKKRCNGADGPASTATLACPPVYNMLSGLSEALQDNHARQIQSIGLINQATQSALQQLRALESSGIGPCESTDLLHSRTVVPRSNGGLQTPLRSSKIRSASSGMELTASPQPADKLSAELRVLAEGLKDLELRITSSSRQRLLPAGLSAEGEIILSAYARWATSAQSHIRELLTYLEPNEPQAEVSPEARRKVREAATAVAAKLLKANASLSQASSWSSR